MSEQEQLTIQHEAGHGSIKLTAYLPSQRVGVEVTGENAVMDWAELFAFVDQFRKPRTITTVEELDALPVGSVLLDRLDICYRLYNDPAHKEPVWCVVGEEAPSSPRGWLPATVLHEGAK